jgi:hypothetical protein
MQRGVVQLEEGKRIGNRLEKPLADKDCRIVSQCYAIPSSEYRRLEVDDPSGDAHGNWMPRKRFPANLKPVPAQHTADRVPTRFEKPSSGVRKSSHRDGRLGVHEPATRRTPCQQHGAPNQFSVGFELERILVTSHPGLLQEDVCVNGLPRQVFKKFGDRPVEAVQGGHEVGTTRRRDHSHRAWGAIAGASIDIRRPYRSRRVEGS